MAHIDVVIEHGCCVRGVGGIASSAGASEEAGCGFCCGPILGMAEANGTSEGGRGRLPGADVERYSRQLLLPSFGLDGQVRLRSARVLIVGVGGLGCPAALYLSGAGVGTLGLVDRPGEVVERSNLHRQIAHKNANVGMDKVTSAEMAIRALNPSVNLVSHKKIDPTNAVQLVSGYDIVLDCTDNVRSRYLVNDACVAARVPLVSGSAIGLEGQLTVYGLHESTPCYRCLFPKPPPPQCVGSCDSAGVLGPVPGTIGTLQALEALKILAGIQGAESLAGRLLLFDAASAEFRTVKLRHRVQHCPACGDCPSIVVANFDYDTFAFGRAPPSQGGSGQAPKGLPDSRRISAKQYAEMRERARSSTSHFLLLDVRPRAQFAMCALEEARNIPEDELRGALLDSLRAEQRPVIIVCRRGNASQRAAKTLLDAGLNDVVDVRGGLQAWHHEVDKEFPLY